MATNTPDFDIEKYENSPKVDYDIDQLIAQQKSGQDGNGEFDIFSYEAGNQKPAPSPSSTSVEGRPQIPRPAPPTLSPSEEMPVSRAEQDSIGAAQTAKQLGIPAAVGVAGGAGAVMTADALPALVQTLSAAAKAHPIAAKVIQRGLEGSALEAGWKLSKKVFGE